MDDYIYDFAGTVALYPGDSGWHFTYLPVELSNQLSERFHGLKRGWGSLKVKVLIGETNWVTAIFPDFRTKTYLLPIKQAIRKKEHLTNGSKVAVALQILA